MGYDDDDDDDDVDDDDAPCDARYVPASRDALDISDGRPFPIIVSSARRRSPCVLRSPEEEQGPGVRSKNGGLLARFLGGVILEV